MRSAYESAHLPAEHPTNSRSRAESFLETYLKRNRTLGEMDEYDKAYAFLPDVIKVLSREAEYYVRSPVRDVSITFPFHAPMEYLVILRRVVEEQGLYLQMPHGVAVGGI